MVNKPTRTALKFPRIKIMAIPADRLKKENIIASVIPIFPVGIGRSLVLSINLSIPASCSWLRTEAATDIRRIPRVIRIILHDRCGSKIKYPVNPVKLTGNIIFSLASSR
jgi:hypothetical protein